MSARFKAVRTDRELECPEIDAGLRAAGCELVLLREGVSEDALCAAVREADLLLMCYTPVTARVIESAAKLRGIVKYGVGIDAIDIAAAIRRGIPVVNVPQYAEETVAEGAFALSQEAAFSATLELKRNGMKVEPVPFEVSRDLKRLGEKFSREWVATVGHAANDIFIPFYDLK